MSSLSSDPVETNTSPEQMPRVITSSRSSSRKSSPRSMPRRHHQPSNTLILTSLPQAFFHPSVLEPLRNHFETYGPLYSWAPIKGFGRVIVVFHDIHDAERMRQDCDGLQVGNDDSSLKTLRIYRGDPTPTEPIDPESIHLKVPSNPRNQLISPPGSPPVGWEQTVEDPPNTSTLAADLVAALNKLQMIPGDNNIEPRRTPDGREVLMGPGSDGVDGPTILLDDTHAPSSPPPEMDEDVAEPLSSAHEDYYSVTPRRVDQRFNAGRGVGPISQIKATAASMGLPMGSPGILPTRIPPTSMHA